MFRVSGMYYCFNMLLIITAIFVSVFVIFVSRQAESKRYPPRWMTQVSAWMEEQLHWVNGWLVGWLDR
jgi:hypothetical membrane protein